MSKVNVNYADNAAEVAKKLLKAAKDPADVLFSPDGFFTVDEEIADKAGVSYEAVDDDGRSPLESPSAPSATEHEHFDEPEAPKQGSSPTGEPVDGGDGGPVAHQDTPQAKADAKADEPLRGKALDEALTKAGLPTSGKVAEKQARLAEHQSKE